VTDDLARVATLLAPVFKARARAILCFVSLLYAVVGVAGGCTRAAVTQHQAIADNAADVSAKDGSQETLVHLVGLLLGLALAPHLEAAPAEATWLCCLLFSALHVFANVRAVRSLALGVLNERRAQIVMREWLTSRKMLTPADLAQLEPLVFSPRPDCALGVSLGQLSSDGESVARQLRLGGAVVVGLAAAVPEGSTGRDLLAIRLRMEAELLGKPDHRAEEFFTAAQKEGWSCNTTLLSDAAYRHSRTKSE